MFQSFLRMEIELSKDWILAILMYMKPDVMTFCGLSTTLSDLNACLLQYYTKVK